MKLNEVRDNRRAQHARKRLGRGGGSGTGKTCGRGTKGQKSRSGVSLKGVGGGQTPIYRQLPKRGRMRRAHRRYAEVTLARIQRAIHAGKISAELMLSEDQLIASGVVVRYRSGSVKLLSGGKLESPITLEVSRASKAAAEAVRKAGGQIIVRSQTRRVR